MLEVTDQAKAHLAELLEQSGADEEAAVRLTKGDSGLDLVLDTPQPGDQTVEHDGSTVLVLEQQLAELLGSRTLDISTEQEQAQLTIK